MDIELHYSTDIFGSSIRIVDDLYKGRCLESQRNYSVGEILFVEDALVYASFHERDSDISMIDNLELLQRVFSPSVMSNLAKYELEFENLDSFQSLDTVRCWFQLIAIISLNKSKSYPIDIIPDYHQRIEFLLKLSTNLTNCNKYIQDIKKIRKKYPKIIPTNFSHEELANLLGILNNNQHELEHYEGAGLFVCSAIMEHSCFPNCSFSTYRTQLIVTAINNIKAGERISIDYKNNYYSPNAERIESLLSSYGFTCSCESCVGPDRKRSFICPSCQSSLSNIYVCPIGLDDTCWAPCTGCGYLIEESHKQIYLSTERYYIENFPTTVEALRKIETERIINKSHYIMFQAWDEIAMSETESARATGSFATYEIALEAMGHVIELMESSVLPKVHHEKVIMYDKLAQLAVASNKSDVAELNYRKAYEMSKLACGSLHPSTILLKILAEKTPLSIAELMLHYSK